MSTVQQPPTVEVPLSASRDEQVNVARQSAVQAADQMVDFDRVMYFIRSLREGKLPNNQQLKTILQQIRTNPGIDRRINDLSKDGQALLSDFRQLVQVLENCLDKKNGGELTQSLIYHLRHVDAEALKNQASSMSAPGVDKQQVKQTAKSGFANVKMIAKLVFVNDEFQNLANELIDVLKDIFGETQERMMDTVRDKADQLKQEHPPKVKKGDVKSKLDQRQERLQQAGSAGGGDIDTEQLKQEMGRQWQDTKEKYSQGMQKMKQSTGKEARQQVEATKETIQQRFPEEKQRELIDRLKLVMMQVQKNSEYQQAMDALQRAFSHWSSETRGVHDQVGEVANRTAEQMKSDANMSQAGLEAKTIVEDWANGQTLDPLIESVKQFFSDIKNDNRLDDYIHQLWDYTQRLVKEPGYVTDEQSTTDGQKLVEVARSADFDSYRSCLSEMADHAQTFCQALAQDPTAMEIKQVLKKIHRDLWLDMEGNPTFKPHLLKDIGISLLPAILDKISTMPIPHIEYHDDKVDVAVENMILTGSSLLPGEMDIKMYNHMRYSSQAKSNNQQTLYIHLSNIHVQMEDVVFYYKKMGFPSISDRGVAKVNTYGKGMALTLGLTSDSNNDLNTYTVETCNCLVDKLDFHITDSRHSLLYKTVHPLVITIVKRQLGKIIAAKVREGLTKGDVWLTRQLKQHGVPLPLTTTTTTATSTNETSMRNNLGQKRPGLFAALITIINNKMKLKKRGDSLNRQSHMDSYTAGKMAKEQQKLERGQQKAMSSSSNQQTSGTDMRQQSDRTGAAVGATAGGMGAGAAMATVGGRSDGDTSARENINRDQQQPSQQGNQPSNVGGTTMDQETSAGGVPLRQQTSPSDRKPGADEAYKDTSVYGTPVGQNTSPRVATAMKQQQSPDTGGGKPIKGPKTALNQLNTMDQQHLRDNVALGQNEVQDNAMLGQHRM